MPPLAPLIKNVFFISVPPHILSVCCSAFIVKAALRRPPPLTFIKTINGFSCCCLAFHLFKTFIILALSAASCCVLQRFCNDWLLYKGLNCLSPYVRPYALFRGSIISYSYRIFKQNTIIITASKLQLCRK